MPPYLGICCACLPANILVALWIPFSDAVLTEPDFSLLSLDSDVPN